MCTYNPRSISIGWVDTIGRKIDQVLINRIAAYIPPLSYQLCLWSISHKLVDHHPHLDAGFDRLILTNCLHLTLYIDGFLSTWTNLHHFRVGYIRFSILGHRLIEKNHASSRNQHNRCAHRDRDCRKGEPIWRYPS